jgi:DNA-binding Lrp family transcriptional regulator
MLDNIDYKIIRTLQTSGRMTIQELASAVKSFSFALPAPGPYS